MRYNLKKDKRCDIIKQTKREVHNMKTNSLDKRYCSIEDSLVDSCKEVKLMREGKKKKRSFSDLLKDIEKWNNEN